jgi:hypothetical protein
MAEWLLRPVRATTARIGLIKKRCSFLARERFAATAVKRREATSSPRIFSPPRQRLQKFLHRASACRRKSEAHTATWACAPSRAAQPRRAGQAKVHGIGSIGYRPSPMDRAQPPLPALSLHAGVEAPYERAPPPSPLSLPASYERAPPSPLSLPVSYERAPPPPLSLPASRPISLSSWNLSLPAGVNSRTSPMPAVQAW